MEKRKCKLCFKSFTNGRALGGHMRSHMLILPVPPKVTEQEMIQLSQESESASYSLSSSDEEKGQLYELRENPKRTIRMVDPEFVDAGSVLQDRGSETESSKNPTRKRSKQTRRVQQNHQHQQQEQERQKLKVNNQVNKTESWAEPEPVSSISDTTTEEDVAFCLIMLSRDQWETKVVVHDNQDDDDDDDDDDEESMKEYYKSSKVNYRTIGGRYKCETCNKVFKSYQALGGHRASHKKRQPATTHERENVGTITTRTTSSISMTVKKIHECPVCFRVFSSGQALGGHKRSHVITGQVATTTSVKNSKKLGDSFIDLNLPAPIDDDDDDASVSQIEFSAVSDAEFVNHFKR